MKGRKIQAACPGLPSPSGVHLVTHPLHRAEYMRGSEGEKGEGGRERGRKRAHTNTHTGVSPFYNIRVNGQGNERCAGIIVIDGH